MSEPICQIRVLNVDLRVLPMRTRFPFRYGIASLSVLPHVFVDAEVEVDGQIFRGISSDGLPPKWFTKNPRTTNEQDLVDMIAVIQNAARIATVFTKTQPMRFFPFWQLMQKEQSQWAFKLALPPLLWHFGVSLIERAVLEAICKAQRTPLHELIKTHALGVDWGKIHPGLDDHTAQDFLPQKPLESAHLRHTIGLGDPIRYNDIPPNERLDDGLPQALEDCIPAYGLRYFKIKLSGDVNADTTRLRLITEVITHFRGDDFFVTFDGNENFLEIAMFRGYFEKLKRDAALKPLLYKLLWVEQPIHRDKALADPVAKALLDWSDAPALIIDESDGPTGDAHKALKLGYSGISHKNCKGILKGLANAALIHHHRRLRPKKNFILSGEDLVNVGPVALTQDLAVMAMLGIEHIERNGHHYFRGLSMYPQDLAEMMTKAHPDLYGKNISDLITLRIEHGKIGLQSVSSAPFGCGLEPDLSIYPTMKQWVAEGGIQQLQ